MTDMESPGEGTVAALFVATNGVYFGNPEIDPWDEHRDARLYAGPHPVVAHPPCNKWSPLAYINRKRIPGYKIGDDGGCFEAALAAVRTWGGVIEHPAESLAWKHYGLARPERGLWKDPNGGLRCMGTGQVWLGSPGGYGSPGSAYGPCLGCPDCERAGWVTEVDQGRYGHRARKRTWLYATGMATVPEPLDWEIATSDAIVSGFTHQAKGQHVACEHRRIRPAEASRTPEAFRDVLLSIARSAGVTSAVAV